MKVVRLCWDLFFGVLLIGGAPMSVMALTVILGDFYQSLFHVVISDGIGFAVFGVMFISMVAVFFYAIRFRLRRRLLPGGFIAAEVLLGIIGAFFLFSLYGVLMYSIIG